MSREDWLEEWRPVVGLEGKYSISNLGRVRCEMKKSGTNPGRIMRHHLNKGYPMVILYYESRKGKNYSVHSLVAAAFIGPRPEGQDINHIDGKRDNPRVDNLEYCTRSENQFHAKRVMMSAVGSNNGTSKLTEQSVADAKMFYQNGSSLKELGEMYSVSPETISRAIRGKTWRHVA